jgi:hypothetical protein
MSELQVPIKNDLLPLNDAVKIKCCYCDLKNICTRRKNKEKYEQIDWITRCTLSPNRPGVKRKKRKKRKSKVKS